MIRALVWKEIREHRWTFFGLALILLCLKPALCWMAEDAIREGRTNVLYIGFTLVGLCLPAYALVLGTHTFAHERGRGTLAFLLTRPVGRMPILATKLLVSLGFLGLGAATATLVINEGSALGWDDVTLVATKTMGPTAMAILVVLWAAAVAGSTFCRSFLPTLLLGGAFSAAFFTSVGALDLGNEAFPATLVLAAASALAVAHGVFDLPFDSALRTRIGRGLRSAAVAAGLSYLALHGLHLFSGADPSSARIVDLHDSPAGISADLDLPSNGPFYRPVHLPLLRGQDGETTLLRTHRGCRTVRWSPDGRFVALRSYVNHWGFQGSKSRLRIARADGTILHEEYWGRSDHQLRWSRDGKILAVAVAAPSPILFAGPSRSILVLLRPETGERLEIPSARLAKLSAWDWQPVAIRREGRSVLVMVNHDGKEPARLEEIALDGSVLAVHGPFGDDVKPGFSRSVGPDRLLFSWSDGKKARTYGIWDGTRPTELRPILRTVDPWGVLALSDDLSQALVHRVEDLDEDGEKKGRSFLGEHRYAFHLALMPITGFEPSGSAPESGSGFLDVVVSLSRSRPHDAPFPTACWSSRDRAFVYSGDGVTLRLIRPGEGKSTLLVEPRRL